MYYRLYKRLHTNKRKNNERYEVTGVSRKKKRRANFMGKMGFNGWGVVEDRQDPKKLGRVRVRCLGYHSENISDLPTSSLPWAHPMNPITSATVSGVGQTPLGVVEGTWVIGFFQDGAEAQQPIIMGTLPGVPSSLPTKGAGKGFQDRLNANYPKYTETDVNRLAVNDEDNPHPLQYESGSYNEHQTVQTSTQYSPAKRAKHPDRYPTMTVQTSMNLNYVQDAVSLQSCV